MIMIFDIDSILSSESVTDMANISGFEKINVLENLTMVFHTIYNHIEYR